MEDLIKKATEEIVDLHPNNPELTPLLDCASRIAVEAILYRSGKLRDITLQIAKSIADYDYEVRKDL